MLFFEGLFYGFSGIAFGIIFSFVILYILYNIAIKTELYLLNLPFNTIIYVIILVYSVILVAMMSARRKIKYQNIIDDVKINNI